MRAIVVGTGFGCRVHVPALRAAGFDVAGLVGTDPARLARKAAEAGIAESFTDLDAAIAATGARLVSIATPPATHESLALAAIARGCHVLCEKPFAMNAGEAERLLAAAEAARVVHAVAHEFRWAPDRAAFGRAIADGLIGAPRFLLVDQLLPLYADPQARVPGWWFDAAAGGGWLGANGSHLIDQIRLWLGEFESVSAATFNASARTGAADDSYSVRFRLAGGAEGGMQQSVAAWGPPATLVRCVGTDGSVWLDAGKAMIADRAGTRELPLTPLPAPPRAEGAPDRPAPFELAPFVALALSLRDAIAGRADPAAPRLPDFRDGVAAMRVLDAIRTSAGQGGALVTVDAR